MYTVERLARLLDVPEIVVFEEAYERWYNAPPDMTRLKQDYSRYLRAENDLPDYVKCFVDRTHVLVA